VSAALPEELGALLGAADPATFDAAWAAFLSIHSPLLLSVARSLTRDRDAAMDIYAYFLERLQEDDCRRLRAFRNDGRARFSTWLVVVARRLGLDHRRQRYGRFQDGPSRAQDGADVRRRLADLIGGPIQPDDLAVGDAGPDERLEIEERAQALGAALAGLDERDRLLLVLRFRDDLSAREIASVLGWPTPFHVYRRLKLLLARLREDLPHLGDASRGGPGHQEGPALPLNE
jgi:RNA polymerase sigma factor (sigma-70 family)